MTPPSLRRSAGQFPRVRVSTSGNLFKTIPYDRHAKTCCSTDGVRHHSCGVDQPVSEIVIFAQLSDVRIPDSISAAAERLPRPSDRRRDHFIIDLAGVDVQTYAKSGELAPPPAMSARVRLLRK